MKRSKRSSRKNPSLAARRDRKNDGKHLENQVARLYELLGAEVVQNVEICSKKVDILATFRLPGSSTGHRVIIECKDEKRAVAQNQRVMQFEGLLTIARKAAEADSAEIITRVPWGDAAKGFARSAGVGLLTYGQKVAQLLDFRQYLEDCVSRFTKRDVERPSEPPLGSFYVDPRGERIEKRKRVEVPDVLSFVKDWSSKDTSRQLAVLGEYGTGKTSLCRKIAFEMAKQYLAEPGSCRIPVLLSLREFTKTLSIESLVSSFLDQECGVTNPRFRLFQAMNEAGILLLVFDGFDEMAVRVDKDTLEMNMREIERLAAARNSRVLLTSRIEHFVSAGEQLSALQPKGGILVTRDVEYEAVTLCPWDDKRIDTFLQKRVPLIRGVKKPWTYYRERIRNIPGLPDLAHRPVLLDMIVKTLPKLVASGTPIDRPNLYRTYLVGEINRQSILKKRRLLLPTEARLSLLKKIAADFCDDSPTPLSFDSATEYIESAVRPPKGEREAYTREFLTCSFLARTGDDFRSGPSKARQN